jgi:hypothetical protein
MLPWFFAVAVYNFIVTRQFLPFTWIWQKTIPALNRRQLHIPATVRCKCSHDQQDCIIPKINIMRLLLLPVLTLVINTSTPTSRNAQNINQTDSIFVSKLISGFYTWYIGAIKDHKSIDYQPRFIENKGGYTTLDFDNYVENLKANGFSDSLIQDEIKSYSECISKLATVKYSDFKKSVFVDLDEYEQYKCDFSNKYRWIGGQEICDGIKITNLKFSVNKRCQVIVKKYNLTNEKEYFWWDYSIYLLCTKTNNKWEIKSIEIK